MEIPEATRREIERAIHSEDSPVGIDAKATHVIIIAQLRDLQERMERLERTLEQIRAGSDT